MPGESLSPSTKIDSVKEKYLAYNMTNRMRSFHMKLNILVSVFYKIIVSHNFNNIMSELDILVSVLKYFRHGHGKMTDPPTISPKI